jgi:Bacteriophage baseplate protein W
MPFRTNPIADYLGKGMIFPIQLNNGAAVISSGTDLIESSIKVILTWPLYQRFYLSEFGSRLEDLIEEPNDNLLESVIEQFVIQSIAQWERRIRLLSAQVIRPNSYEVNISISYQIINTQVIGNFVFPFYPKIIY